MKKKNKMTMNRMVANAAFWMIMILLGAAFIYSSSLNAQLEKLPISEVVAKANNGEISRIEVQGNEIRATLKGEELPTIVSRKEGSSTIYEQGLNQDTPAVVEILEIDNSGEVFWNLAIIFVPTLAIIAFFMFMMRQAGGQNNQAMSFGKSKAKLYGEDKKKVGFDDIAGNDNAKQDLYEVVDFLKDPKKYQKMGAKIPSGVLMVGNPGTGKTMLARAVAGEAKVPFFSISGSEFMEMFVGVGASRVRDLFMKAKKNSPSIIFIDEIDAVGRRRGSGMGGGHDEREQTLNQILVEMDGFEKDTGVIVLAATNRVDVLDPALLRPGRFDRRVEITLPERKDRLDILRVHFKNKPVDKTIDLESLAKKTAGSSGADLANIANEAAILAARNGRDKIINDDLTEAFEKVAIGPERKTKVMSDREKEATAYHEAGHAVVGHVLPDSDPVHKVTIIPRGQTGGVTWFLPPEDKSYNNIFEYKDILARAMGGRKAEELIYGEAGISTGASSDLRSATNLARNMVVELGMGVGLRDQVFHQEEGGMFFDKITSDRPYSEKTAERIDVEVAALLDESVKRAEVILKSNRKALEDLKNALLEKETVDDEEVAEILKNAKLPKEAKLYD